MTEQEKSEIVDKLDEIGVSARRVRNVTGMSSACIGQAMAEGRFPLPVPEISGMRYWRMGDIARLELGWA